MQNQNHFRNYSDIVIIFSSLIILKLGTIIHPILYNYIDYNNKE